ncbi:SH3 domain-containing protein [Streptomyces anandii]|uniref:SH3 domain-containing protein n=1 Tax=Streptomyces anandii TaxID=285454 RepID=UPI0037B7939D
MSLHSPLTRLAVAAAAGVLLTATAVVPAVADDGRGGTPDPAAAAHAAAPAPSPAPGGTASGTGATAGKTTAADKTDTAGKSSVPAGQDDPRFYRGRVVARGGLALHTRPDRGSRVLRIARPGEIVWIYCATLGQNVLGNRVWYLLADGTWSWGSARFIQNIGPAPRWC